MSIIAAGRPEHAVDAFWRRYHPHDSRRGGASGLAPRYRCVMDLPPIVPMVLAIVAVWVLLLVVFWIVRPRGVAARELLALIPDVLRLLRSIVMDRHAPLDARLVVAGLTAWILSPIDLIPEFIPVLGPLDDVVVAVAALRYLRRRLGVPDLRARWTGSPDGFAVLLRVVGDR